MRIRPRELNFGIYCYKGYRIKFRYRVYQGLSLLTCHAYHLKLGAGFPVAVQWNTASSPSVMQMSSSGAKNLGRMNSSSSASSTWPKKTKFKGNCDKIWTGKTVVFIKSAVIFMFCIS